MKCPNCQNEIQEGSKFCPQCGRAVISIEQVKRRKESGLAVASMILGIVGILTFCMLIGMVFGVIALILGIISLIKINKQKEELSGKGFAITGIITGGMVTLLIPIVGILAAIAIPNFKSAMSHSNVSTIQQEMRTIATALEAYYIDYDQYPLPQYDNEDNAVLPSTITTPIAYATCILNDIYNDTDNDHYRYYTDSSTKWIVASFGPDKKSGNSGIQGGINLDIESALTDDELGFPLQSSPLTYDPTNGTKSPGDIWRRGP